MRPARTHPVLVGTFAALCCMAAPSVLSRADSRVDSRARFAAGASHNDKFAAFEPEALMRREGPGVIPQAVRRRLGRLGVGGSAPTPVSPPNVRANDISGDLPNEIQSHVSIAAWKQFVVVVWLDSKVLNPPYEAPPFTGVEYAYSSDGGATFTHGGNVPRLAADDQTHFGSVVADGRGRFDLCANYLRGLQPGSFEDYLVDCQAVWVGTADEEARTYQWGPPVIVAETPAASGEGFLWPVIAADPLDGYVYVAYPKQYPGPNKGRQIEVAVSSDGGAHWADPVAVSQRTLFLDDPQLAVGPGHEVYLIWSAWEGLASYCDMSNRYPFNDGVVFSRSLTRGASWESESWAAAKQVCKATTGPGNYAGWDDRAASLAVDRSGGPANGTIYVTWTDSARWDAASTVTDSTVEVEPNDRPRQAAPIPKGGSATGATETSADPDYWRLDLAAGDNLFVRLVHDGWTCAIDSNRVNNSFRMRLYADAESLDAVPALSLVSSATVEWALDMVFGCRRTGSYILRVTSVGSPDSIPYKIQTGLVSFLEPSSDAPARDFADIVEIHSTTGGLTWSPKQVIDADSPPGYYEEQPAVAVDAAGKVVVVWYDRRETELALNAGTQAQVTDLYMSQSVDAGQTFSIGRPVTDESSLYAGVPRSRFTFGIHAGLVASGGRFYAAWADGRVSNSSVSLAYTNVLAWPQVDTDVSRVEFQTLDAGDVGLHRVEIRNPGSSTLDVQNIELPIEDVRISPAPPYRLAPGTSRTLDVSYEPLAPHDLSGAIRILTNDPFSPALAIPISAHARSIAYDLVSAEFFRESIVLQSQEIPVIAVMGDSVRVDSVSVHYREGGASEFSLRRMELLAAVSSKERYRAFIPTSVVGPRGFEFFVSSHNGRAFYSAPSMDNPIQFRVRVPDLGFPQSQPAGRYEMVSVPLEVQGASFGDLFGDDLGAPVQDWRVYWRPDDTRYAEGTRDGLVVEQGRAYWLVTRGEVHLDTGPVLGLSTPLNAPFGLALRNTWSMIASPFAFPVSWGAVLVNGMPMQEQALVEPPQYWNPATAAYEEASELVPFRGYFVKKSTPEDVTLLFPPRMAPAPASPSGTASKPGDGWRIAIRASSGGARDACEFGVFPGAALAWDRYDRSDPPVAPGEALTVYTPHPDWPSHRGHYARDLRPPFVDSGSGPAVGQGHCWRFDVDSSAFLAAPVRSIRLGTTGIEGVPSTLRSILIDHHLGRAVDLREVSTYEFLDDRNGVSSDAEPRFELLVGDESFVADRRGPDGALPSRTRLLPSLTNPVRVATIVRYELSHPGRVELRVFDVHGRLVGTLENAFEDAGRHEVAWKAGADHGTRVAAGVYFVRFESQGVVDTHRIVVIR